MHSESAFALGDGNFFDPFNIEASSINIEGAAKALSNLCRFNGHTPEFYSVAQHSMLVSEMAFEETRDPKIALWGLLHDVTEAYLGDVPRPVKYRPEFAFYRDIEEEIMETIAVKYDLPWPMPKKIKEIDSRMLITEAESFGMMGQAKWPEAESYGFKIIPMFPSEAEVCFLSEFGYLMESFD